MGKTGRRTPWLAKRLVPVLPILRQKVLNKKTSAEAEVHERGVGTTEKVSQNLWVTSAFEIVSYLPILRAA